MRKKGRSLYNDFLFIVLLLCRLISIWFPGKWIISYIAFIVLGDHAIVYLFCVRISLFRFKSPAMKYVEIKNKVLRKIFICPIVERDADCISSSENKVNLLGLLLNVINLLLFVSFEFLLFMPPIPSLPYAYTDYVPNPHIGIREYDFELHSLNEIIVAEGSTWFSMVIGLIWFVLFAAFELRRGKGVRKNRNQSLRKTFKDAEWYNLLYNSLINICVRRSNKKHKFWYEAGQITKIENLVRAASKHAELKLERKGNKLVSFQVADTLNDHVMFTGFFIK